jgi:hypothetical protein
MQSTETDLDATCSDPLAWAGLLNGMAAAGSVAPPQGGGRKRGPGEEFNDGDFASADGSSSACDIEACIRDVEASGKVDPATDIVYMARRLVGLIPVPLSCRARDPTSLPEKIIAARIDIATAALDVDANGTTDVGRDMAYIARGRLGLVPAPASSYPPCGFPPERIDRCSSRRAM